MGETYRYERPWAAILAVIVLALVVAGGTSAPSPEIRLSLSLVSLAGILSCAWLLRGGFPHGLAAAGVAIIGLMLLAFGLQHIPVPASMAAMLPGRAAIFASLEAAGVGKLAMPISLALQLTRDSLLATLPGIFMFCAALTVAPRRRSLVVFVVVAAAIVSALLGVGQRFTGSAAWHLYDGTGAGTASGFFANRNFFAALLYLSIPLLGALTLGAIHEQKLPGWLAALFGLVYLSVILGGLAAAQSRAGIILCMAAILATALFPWGSLNSLKTRASRRVMLYGVMTFLFVFGQFGLVGLLRVAETDPLTDYRATIAHVSWKALWQMFPVGSGFGTFVPIYQMFETPADLKPQFVNHAHNDWLEIVLEGGLPALILLVAFLSWFAFAGIRLWTRRSEAPGDLVMMASSVSVALLMLHSIVDYPLRTPALMGLFGLMCGFMASGFTVRRTKARQSWDDSGMQASTPRVPRKPMKPFRAEADTGQQSGGTQ